MTASSDPKANTMWGGRFASGPDAIMTAINASIGFDQRLYAQDIAGSRAHAAMLAATGIITPSDAETIGEGLLTVLSEIEEGRFTFRTDLEDIHLNIESRLTEIVGEPGKRLHTGRSRNDQVATDFRLWVRDQCDAAISGLTALMQAFLAQAEAGCRLGHARLYPSANRPARHLGPPHAGLCRDAGTRPFPLCRCPQADERMPARRRRAGRNLLPDRPPHDRRRRSALTAPPPIQPRLASQTATSRWNSCRASSICAMHLSRFAEELVIWSSAQFRFVRLSDKWTTGSSIMPQKKNPDAAELLRAKLGRILGATVALFTVMKGLALTYSKDMQEDKEQVFDAADTLMLSACRDDRHGQ